MQSTEEKRGGGARELSLRAQRKLLPKLGASGAGKALLLDEAASSLLDSLHRLMEAASRERPALTARQPDKVLKNIVKLSIKLGLLQRERQLDPTASAELRKALRALALAVLSFYELDFSYDRAFLATALERCRVALRTLVEPRLSDKSLERVEQVFGLLAHPDFLEAVFGQRSQLRPALSALARDLGRALDAGHL